MPRTPRSSPDDLASLHLRMQACAAAGGGAISARAAAELGAGDGDVRALMRLGLWGRPRRAVYADPTFVPRSRDPQHTRDAAALLAAVGPATAISHTSSARLLGLPTPRLGWPDCVTITRPSGAHGTLPRGARVHVASSDASELVVVDGLPVLGGARMVLDCATMLDGPDALAIADSALRRGLTTVALLGDERLRRAAHPGARRAGRIADLADGGSESWFESASRWWLADAGLPRPVLQHEFRSAYGVARVDMWFERFRTVGEADGAQKYAGSDGPRALVGEKRREEWLRDEFGVEVVRWMPRDLATPRARAAWLSRLQAAFARGSRQAS